ncbi:MAG: GAP family protein, partial [Xylophilus sp.]|nr:GAP family protein [Xylophilus sp.]MBP6618456.1 GAP family protein [Burkholderiaceae bacterium]
SRPRNGAVAPQPTWMDMLDTLSVPKAGGLGLALTTVNPKNLLLVVAGALSILAASPGPLGQWIALIVFTAIASLGVAAPAVLYLVLGDRAAAPLAQTKAWIVQNNATTMATVLLLLGLVVLGNGLEQLQAA